MSDLKTVRIVQVRACDLPEGGTVRKRPGDVWQHVYEVTRGGEESAYGNAEADTISKNDLDERYVVLRLSIEPSLHLAQGTRRRAEGLSVEKRRFAVTPGSGKFLEQDVFDDQLEVARAHALWDLQVVVPVTEWMAD